MTAPTSAELTRLAQILAQRIGRFLERQQTTLPPLAKPMAAPISTSAAKDSSQPEAAETAGIISVCFGAKKPAGQRSASSGRAFRAPLAALVGRTRFAEKHRQPSVKSKM